MTNQMQGEILFGGWDGGASGWAHTPWVTARGDIGTFGVQVVQRNGVTLTWNVETRTSESAAVESLFATDRTVASVTTDVATNSGATDVRVKELVRYRFATGSASVTDFVVLRALAPSWRLDW
jgi:hypothetical protein